MHAAPRRLVLALSVAALIAATALSARADVHLHRLFTDHMVLQRGMKVPVWGTAGAGEQITVALLGATGKEIASATAKADGAGAWRADLPTLEAGGPFDLRITAGAGPKPGSLILHDVLVGDVWLCTGQSNMYFQLGNCFSGPAAVATSNLPRLRLEFINNTKGASAPLKQLSATQVQARGWVASGPDTAVDFPAVGYFFGRQLLHDLHVPIGLIRSSVGATIAQTWTSRTSLLSSPRFKPEVTAVDNQAKAWMASLDAYSSTYKDWVAAVRQADAAGTAAPDPPAIPEDPRTVFNAPAALYNNMIAPLAPFAIKGVIWYQGEYNADMGAAYRELLTLMITDWRRTWGQGDFPFLIVQLPAFYPPVPEPGESTWSELREAQLMTTRLPHTGAANTIDLGNAAEIHPRDKEDVGLRLALVARAVAYGQTLVSSGPTYESMSVEGRKVRLKFRDVGGGLVIGAPPGPPTNLYDPPPVVAAHLRGFAIAGKDHTFVWGDAVIDGDTVVVSSPKVDAPVAVRYDWADNPNGNLYNKEHLPAWSFRTDGPAGGK